MDNLSSPITIHTKVDGHTWVSELSDDEIRILITTLSIVNCQLHGDIVKAAEYVKWIDSFEHEHWHNFLDKMFNVLHPVVKGLDEAADPTPGDEWKNSA